jgi:hypothetical protein
VLGGLSVLEVRNIAMVKRKRIAKYMERVVC